MKKAYNYILAILIGLGLFAGFYFALWLGFVLGFDM